MQQQDRRCVGGPCLAVEDLDPVDLHRLIRRHLASHSVGAVPRTAPFARLRTAVLTTAATGRAVSRCKAPRTALTEEFGAKPVRPRRARCQKHQDQRHEMQTAGPVIRQPRGVATASHQHAPQEKEPRTWQPRTTGSATFRPRSRASRSSTARPAIPRPARSCCSPGTRAALTPTTA